MSSNLLLSPIDPKLENDHVYRHFAHKILSDCVHYEYNDEEELYYLYSSNKMIPKKLTQIGKFFRMDDYRLYHLRLFDYNIEFDYELLNFIEDNFAAIDKYLKENQDYEIKIGIGRYMDSQTVQSFDFLDKWYSIYGNSVEVKRILAILFLIRKINFQDYLDKYDDIFVLDSKTLESLYKIIYTNDINMYHVMYLVKKYKNFSEQINSTIMKIGINMIFDGMSYSSLKLLPEFQFFYYLKNLLDRDVTTEEMREMLENG